MSPTHDPHDPIDRQRHAQARARRTAWLLGALALALYLGFLASGVFGK